MPSKYWVLKLALNQQFRTKQSATEAELKLIELLSQGGFDKRYWDLEVFDFSYGYEIHG